MAELVKQLHLQKSAGYMYYLDKQGNVSATPMKNSGIKDYAYVAAYAYIQREPNYLYFISTDGDIMRVRMNRGGTKGRNTRPMKHPSKKKKR